MHSCMTWTTNPEGPQKEVNGLKWHQTFMTSWLPFCLLLTVWLLICSSTQWTFLCITMELCECECSYILLFVFLVTLGEKTIRSVTCTFLPQFGRIDPHYPKVCGHQGNVLDIKWNPFHDNIIASCSEDSSVSKLEVQVIELVSITKKELWKPLSVQLQFCCLFIFVLINEKTAFTFHDMEGERVLPH